MPSSSIGKVLGHQWLSRWLEVQKVFNKQTHILQSWSKTVHSISSQRWCLCKNAYVVWSHTYLSVYAQSPRSVKFWSCPQRPGQQQVFFLKLGGGQLHVVTAGLRRRKGMSGASATGIRLVYCEMERPGNLPSYPPEQHNGRCRHKYSGSDVSPG